MIPLATWLFWTSLAVVAYTVVGYGLILLVLSRLRPPREARPPARPMVVDFLIPAYNEAAHIVAKIENTLAQKNSQGHRLRVLVVSDGSSDGTAALARKVQDPRVEVIETPGRVGKLEAINMALERLDGDIVVFSDANAILAEGSLEAIMSHFGHADIGGVCGRITVDQANAGSIARSEGWYWRYDQALKAAEDRLGGTVSAQGSIYAIRRQLCGALPAGVADDFFMSVRVVDQGYRLAFEPKAQTRERVTEKAAAEMGRRIRSTEMGWRALMAHARLMNPLRTGTYGWQLFSHKFLRRLMPMWLAILLVASLALSREGPGFAIFAALQVTGYALGILAYFLPAVRSVPLAGKAMFFVMSNVAMTLGLVAYFRDAKIGAWEPVRDDD